MDVQDDEHFFTGTIHAKLQNPKPKVLRWQATQALFPSIWIGLAEKRASEWLLNFISNGKKFGLS